MGKKKCSFNRRLSILKFSMIASLRGHKQGKGKPLLFSVCKRGFSWPCLIRTVQPTFVMYLLLFLCKLVSYKQPLSQLLNINFSLVSSPHPNRRSVRDALYIACEYSIFSLLLVVKDILLTNQNSWLDSGQILLHQCGISVAGSKTSLVARS